MKSNTYFPALPDYTGPDKGLAGFVHHDELFEHCWSFKERIAFIHAYKPTHEINTRDRCLVYLDPTGQPWETAAKALEEARGAWWGAWREADQARQKAEEAWETAAEEAWREAEEAWWEAEDALLIYAPQIEAQIRSLIPDLPWNGRELMFGEVR